MKEPENYWTYKAPPIPEVWDLPPGVFKGGEREWNSLSPGMRRTIWREAVKRPIPETGCFSVDDDRLNRAEALHKKGEAQIKARELL